MKCKAAFLLVLCVLLLLSGCNCTEEASETIQTEQSTPAETETEIIDTTETVEETVPETEVTVWVPKPVDVTLREKYDIVLEQYREAVLADSEEFIELYWNWQELNTSMAFFEDSQDLDCRSRIKEYIDLPNTETEYPFVNSMILYYMHQYKGEGETLSECYNLQYAYYDLDGNGREELIIVDHRGEWGFSVIGLYGLGYEDKPVTVENSVGNRSHLSMYTDGTISIDGSSSAFEHTVNYYRLDEHFGIYLNSLCSFTINTNNPNVDEIRQLQEQFKAGLTPIEAFDWQPLFTES